MKTKLIQWDYKIFEGRNSDNVQYNAQMPLLVKKGLQPLTAKDIMQYKLQAIQSNNKGEMNFWLNHYWDTVDGLAYHKGQLIVVPNSQELLNINPEIKLSDGSLILSPKQYKQLSKKNEVIKRDKIISEKELTKKQAKGHPIWLKLAQEDKSLLNEYVDAIFAKAKEVYDHDENMGIYLSSDQSKPVMIDWYIGDLCNRSIAGSAGSLDNHYCRLLGVRAQTLEEVLGKIAQQEGVTNPSEVRKALKFYRLYKDNFFIENVLKNIQ